MTANETKAPIKAALDGTHAHVREPAGSARPGRNGEGHRGDRRPRRAQEGPEQGLGIVPPGKSRPALRLSVAPATGEQPTEPLPPAHPLVETWRDAAGERVRLRVRVGRAVLDGLARHCPFLLRPPGPPDRRVARGRRPPRRHPARPSPRRRSGGVSAPRSRGPARERRQDASWRGRLLRRRRRRQIHVRLCARCARVRSLGRRYAGDRPRAAPPLAVPIPFDAALRPASADFLLGVSGVHQGEVTRAPGEPVALAALVLLDRHGARGRLHTPSV